MVVNRYVCRLFLTLAIAASSAAATKNVDAIFGQWNKKTNTPGCAIAVSRKGEIVLERAYGMANLEHAVPITANTIFEAGSVSKQVTAAAIATLVQEGKLSLDDRVRKYIPELPEYASEITIRQLLNHTSGLRDWGTIAEISGWPRGTRAHTHLHVLQLLQQQRALNFAPGTEWSYTNSGYNLAAMIVERVSRQSFPDFTRERFFEPLKMTNSSWRDDYARIVPRRATAYAPDDNGRYRAEMHYENVYGNCCLLTTVGDLLKWTDNFRTQRVGGAPLVSMMEEDALLTSGAKTGYALGLTIGTFRGLREVAHSGATGGYRAYLTRFPERDLAVAVMCNDGSALPPRLAYQVADIFLETRAEELPKVSIPLERLQSYAGLYRDPANDHLLRLHLKDNILRLGFGEGGLELHPLDATRFRIADSQSEIHFENGNARLIVGTRRNSLYTPVPLWKPTSNTPYLGDYISEEAAVVYSMFEKNGKLMVRLPPAENVPLEPTFEDAFRAGRTTLIRFTRDAAGNVDGFELKSTFDMSSGTARVERMRFVR